MIIVSSTLLICLAVYYYFFKKRIKEFDGYNQYSIEATPLIPPFTSQQQIMNLGWTHKKHEGLCPTSYLNYDTVKPDGVYRVGIFGCSFTEGFDAGPGYDFPTLLQKKLEREGYKNIQIINFGTGGYGVGQMLMLYNYIGQKYKLDLVVINSFFFYHFPRDLSFRLYNNYGPLHARYVLNNGALELKEIKDTSLLDAYNNYYSFISPELYRKYDYKPTGYTIPLGKKFNPFYYMGSNTSYTSLITEAYEMYPLMFKEFASKTGKLVVICNDEYTYSMRKGFTKDTSILFYKSHYYPYMYNSISLYTSPTWHMSPLGNELYADELFNVITKRNDALPYLGLKFAMANDSSTGSRNFDSIGFKIGNSIAKKLYRADQAEIGGEDWNREPDYVDGQRLLKDSIHQLLLLSTGLNDLSFIDAAQELKNGDSIILLLTTSGKEERIAIGTVSQINPAVFRVQLSDTMFITERHMINFKTDFDDLLSDFRFMFLSAPDKATISMLIGQNKYEIPVQTQKGKLSRDGDLFNFNFNGMNYFLVEDQPDETLLSSTEIRPRKRPDILHFRGTDDQYINPEEVGVEGKPFSVVVYRGGQAHEYPFLTMYRKDLQP